MITSIAQKRYLGFSAVAGGASRGIVRSGPVGFLGLGGITHHYNINIMLYRSRSMDLLLAIIMPLTLDYDSILIISGIEYPMK